MHVPASNDGTTLLIPPAQRYAIAVTMPAEADCSSRCHRCRARKPAIRNPSRCPASKYTSTGTGNPSAVLGTISMDLADISWNDGFLTFPTQTLLTAEPAAGTAEPVPFESGQKLDGSGKFVDLATAPVAVNRKFTITGAFNNALANDQYKAVLLLHNFSDYTWPSGPLVQPRLGSVEQWSSSQPTTTSTRPTSMSTTSRS